MWAILVGIFVGLAILTKWLTALLVFGGWGLFLLLEGGVLKKRIFWGHLLMATGITALIAMPWQLYILHAFPLESTIAFGHHVRHIKEDLGHPGTGMTHLENLSFLYHDVLTVACILGCLSIFSIRKICHTWTISTLAMIVVLYGFFSLFVRTKMPALVLPVASLLFIFMAIGLYLPVEALSRGQFIPHKIRTYLLSVIVLLMGYITLKPSVIITYRNIDNAYRNERIHNAQVYKRLPYEILKDRIILNCRGLENVDLMFYQDLNAYHWFPEEHILDSLKQKGYRFAAFQNVPGQGLPAYILEDPDILLIPDEIR